MKQSLRSGVIRRARFAASSGLLAVAIGLSACGSSTPSYTGAPSSYTVVPTSYTIEPTSSPFVSLVHLTGSAISAATAVEYTIEPKPGSVSRPVHVQYLIPALSARGYVSAGSLTVPVFGLYAGYPNEVSLEIFLEAGKSVSLEVPIETSDYADPTGIYTTPNIMTRRSPGSSLGFDFIYIKSGLGSPIILDTDGEVRWAAAGVSTSTSSAFVGDGFVIGDPVHPTVYKLGLDGRLSQRPLPAGDLTDFNHDIILGKQSLLAEVDASDNGVPNEGSNVIALQDFSTVSISKRWDLGAILTAYMTANGDDAADFVRPGTDWFHVNSAIYDPSDDSVIVSSRENFVIKLDYQTGAIKWIFGDPTKYWYTFPSLREKALRLAPGGLYPIGQHGLSITRDGLLMLFNDGLGSEHQPAGQPAGETRSYSAVSAYRVDESAMTVQDVWDYTAGQSVYSPVCGSAYEAYDQSLLVDYAVAENYTEALLVGLNSARNVVFEFEYPTNGCNTSWNARPIALDDLVISQ